jgi:hypothetical protein
MKYFFLIVIFIANYSKSHSQTVSLEDTKEWIKDKMESNGYRASDGSVQHQYTVSYDGCNMVITDVVKIYLRGEINSITTTYQVPIHYLSGVLIERRENNTWIIFPTRSTSNIIRVTTKETKTSTWEKSIPVILSKGMSENDMPTRLNKAFNNLITLCGGKLTKEVFK